MRVNSLLPRPWPHGIASMPTPELMEHMYVDGMQLRTRTHGNP